MYPQQGNGPDAPKVVLEWMKNNLPKVAFDELRNYLLTMKANENSATSSRRDTVDLTADDPPGQQQQMQQQSIAALSQASDGQETAAALAAASCCPARQSMPSLCPQTHWHTITKQHVDTGAAGQAATAGMP